MIIANDIGIRLCEFPTGAPHPAGDDAAEVFAHEYFSGAHCLTITLCADCYADWMHHEDAVAMDAEPCRNCRGGA